MVSINELVEEALDNNNIDRSVRRIWKKTTKLNENHSIHYQINEGDQLKGKKEFKQNFNSFEDLKNYIIKKDN